MSAIHLQPQVPRQLPSSNEGAGGNGKKITAVVLSILTALVTFVFLPLEAAVLTTLTLTTLYTLCCCRSNGTADGSARRGFFGNVFGGVRHFFAGNAVRRNVIPVVQPGPRVLVGGALVSPLPPARSNIILNTVPAQTFTAPATPAENAPRAPVGHGHAPAASSPVIILQPAPPPSAFAAPSALPAAENASRIPVGHGHAPATSRASGRLNRGVNPQSGVSSQSSASSAGPNAARVPVGRKK